MVACESGEAPWSSMGVSWAIGESRAMGVSAVELMVCARELVLGMVGDEDVGIIQVGAVLWMSLIEVVCMKLKV